jgi:hypothetical protein
VVVKQIHYEPCEYFQFEDDKMFVYLYNMSKGLNHEYRVYQES